MGRRDEPKLDELQRLLRRLEHMEVDKAPKRPAKPTAIEPSSTSENPGYVGALRGGATEMRIAAAQSRSADDDDEPAAFTSIGTKPQRAASTAPVVIGATTAAVVSSMIVVGLLLATQGHEGGGQAGNQRTNFVAPTEVGGRTAPSPVAPGETESLLQRADVHIRNGRLTEGRTLLEEAARRGSGVAALTLGAMYDPTRVAQFGNLGVQADPTLARAWYERARALGEVEASDRLAELARK
jgi:TPR repeat protein